MTNRTPPTYRSSLDVQLAKGSAEPDPTPNSTQVTYEQMTNDQLRDLLEARDLPTSGAKAELVTRLKDDDHGHSH